MQNSVQLQYNFQPLTACGSTSYNFNDINSSNIITFSSLTETKSYIPITGCVVEHIINTTNLTNHEKLYYLLADSLALINKNKGYRRSYALPSEDWANYLGCSRSLVFTMQKSLVKKGYFIINKDWNEIGLNKRNLIIPTLPTAVFNHLSDNFPDRAGEYEPYNRLTECKRSYLDRTKLFIKLNYDLQKIITSNEYLNPCQKVLWLSFYIRCYKNHILQNNEDFSFISSYRELAEQYSCHTKSLSKSIRALEELGFIKRQNIYLKKRDNDYSPIQARQDQSLWKITLSLPESYILQLAKVKNRSNLKVQDITATIIENSVNQELIEDCLIVGGIKFNLNIEQSSLLKSVITDDGQDIDDSGEIDTTDNTGKSTELEYMNSLVDTSKALSTASSLKIIADEVDNNSGTKSDPDVAKSGLYINKDLISKIKEFKSNLGGKSKVLFNNFLKNLKKSKGNEKPYLEFDICVELIISKLKELPKDKVDKARKFAYSLISKKLATGYATGLNKHDLAKQLIFHIATWKPTKLGKISRSEEIDTALAVAWKSIIAGNWQIPLAFAKAEILNYEYQCYCKKYLETGILSAEIKNLESEVSKLLGKHYNLKFKITKTYKTFSNLESDSTKLVTSNLIATPQMDVINDKYNDYLFNDNAYDKLEHGVKDESLNRFNVDLSHLSDEQKSLTIQGSNTEIIQISTINQHQYFGKLKTLETNSNGDLVMTIAPKDNKLFESLSISAGDALESNIAPMNNQLLFKHDIQKLNVEKNVDNYLFSIQDVLDDEIPVFR